MLIEPVCNWPQIALPAASIVCDGPPPGKDPRLVVGAAKFAAVRDGVSVADAVAGLSSVNCPPRTVCPLCTNSRFAESNAQVHLSPAEREQFQGLMQHEPVESTVMAQGLPYRSADPAA